MMEHDFAGTFSNPLRLKTRGTQSRASEASTQGRVDPLLGGARKASSTAIDLPAEARPSCSNRVGSRLGFVGGGEGFG